MAEKGWTAQAAAAAGVAAGMGAAQLGLGYGLAVVVWPVAATVGDTVWLGSLGWATWIAAGSTVFGAIAGSRLGAAGRPRTGVLWRLTLALAAAVGALLTVVLIAVPARAAVRADTFSPQTTAAGYAVAGILIGILVAYWAVASRPVAANLILTAVWLWGLAVVAIVYGLVNSIAMSGIHLSGWQPRPTGAEFRFGAVQWPEALVMLGAALLIGAVAVWPAARRGDHGLGAATSGAVGPLLVALTFLILVPRVTAQFGELESPYLTAPYAVLAGLAGSALTVALARQAAERRAARSAGYDDPHDAIVPARPAGPARATAPARPTVSARPTVPAVRSRPTVSASVTAKAPAIDTPVAAPADKPRRSGRSAGNPPSADPPSADPASADPASAGRAGGFFGRLKPGRRRTRTDDSDPSAATGSAGTGPQAESSPQTAPVAVPARSAGTPRASTVAPPPETPTVARINPVDANPAAGAGPSRASAAGSSASGTSASGTSAGVARSGSASGRAEPAAPTARKTARPRRSPTGPPTGPDGEGNPA